MSNYILTADGELYHYGVPGMKWGHRKASYASEKSAYRQAKKDFKAAKKGVRKSGLGFGIKGIAKVKAAQDKRDAAELNVLDAKAKYKAAKSKDSAKAEFNTYRKEMQKTGLANSTYDSLKGGKSAKLYDHLTATKGKAYADKVQKKVQNVAVKQLVGSVAVTLGAAVAVGILESRS